MKLCLIVPFSNMKLSTYGDMYYALTKQLNESKSYYNYFKSKKELGFDVYVDNNVHEGEEIDFETHVKLAMEVGTIIIVPDVLRDKKKTLEYYHYFMDKYATMLRKKGIRICCVPQGNTLDEINECFDEFNKDTRVSIIGNSFDLVPYPLLKGKYENQSANRLLIVNDWVKKTNKRIHLLGSNNLSELYNLSKFKQVYSTDGKFFSRISLARIKLTNDNWRSVEKDKDIKMKFEEPLKESQEQIFKKNVLFFREVLQDRHL